MGFCGSLIMVLFIISNIAFFLIGTFILGIGIWVKTDRHAFLDTISKIGLNETSSSMGNSSTSFLNSIAVFLIVLGTVAFVIGFCGCCGAIQKSSTLLYIYAFLVSIIVLGQIVIGIYAGTQQSSFQYAVEETSREILKKEFNGILSKNATEFTKTFTELMFEMKCCGIMNENDFNGTVHKWEQYRDRSIQKHPVGCCKLKTTYKYNSEAKFNYTEASSNMVDRNCAFKEKTQLNKIGCLTKIVDIVKRKLLIVIGFSVGLAFFEIICIVIACCIAHKGE